MHLSTGPFWPPYDATVVSPPRPYPLPKTVVQIGHLFGASFFRLDISNLIYFNNLSRLDIYLKWGRLTLITTGPFWPPLIGYFYIN